MQGNFIEIRNFLDYITILKGYIPTSCGMGGFCSLHTVIESSGGGCRRNLEPFIDNKPSFNYQCSAIKNFFDENIDKLCFVSDLLV